MDTGPDAGMLRQQREARQAAHERKERKARKPAAGMRKRKRMAAAAPVAATPSLGPGRVYLMPLDGFPARRAHALASYVQRKLRVRTSVVGRRRSPSSAYVASRKQIVADAVTRLVLARSRLLADPSSTLIGLTNRDMFIAGKSWRFAFSLRDGEVAVVSSARMNPALYGLPADREVADERLRKMVLKDVAITHFGDFERDDPRSVLYGNVLGTDDLDYMTEEIEPTESPAEARWIRKADAVCERGPSPNANFFLAVFNAEKSRSKALAFLRRAISSRRKLAARFARLPAAPDRRLQRRLLSELQAAVAEERRYEAQLAPGWSTSVFGEFAKAWMMRGLVLQSLSLRLGSASCGTLFDPLPPVPS
jgi:predicted Zn-dependent protease